MSEILIPDYLNRENDIKNVSTIINNAFKNKKSISFAINGTWGSGKTHFIKLVKKNLRNNKLIFIYDAWMNNYYDEPLVGLLEEIRTELNDINSLDNSIKEGVKIIANNIIKNITAFLDQIALVKIGFKPFKSINQLKNFIKQSKKAGEISDDFNSFALIKKAKEIITDALKQLSEKVPTIFIIDELDRCIPSYAIKVIERIHHISMNVNNMATIISIDKTQLEKIIASMYPRVEKDETVTNYMRKIISFTYQLDLGTFSPQQNEIFDVIKSFYNPEIIKDVSFNVDEILSRLFQGLEIRNVIKIVDNMKSLLSMMDVGHLPGADVIITELLIMRVYLNNKNDYKGELEKYVSSELHHPNYMSVFFERSSNFKLYGFDNNGNIFFYHNTKNGIISHLICFLNIHYRHNNVNKVVLSGNAQEHICSFCRMMEKVSF